MQALEISRVVQPGSRFVSLGGEPLTSHALGKSIPIERLEFPIHICSHHLFHIRKRQKPVARHRMRYAFLGCLARAVDEEPRALEEDARPLDAQGLERLVHEVRPAAVHGDVRGVHAHGLEIAALARLVEQGGC